MVQSILAEDCEFRSDVVQIVLDVLLETLQSQYTKAVGVVSKVDIFDSEIRMRIHLQGPYVLKMKPQIPVEKYYE